MDKTNSGLVDYAQQALNNNWGYVWGTFGNLLTEDLLKKKIAQYPEGVGNYEAVIREKWMGHIVTDCVGLIKSYMWWDGSKVRYDAATDVSADSMFAKATVKGAIVSVPEMPGICLWKQGHIGVYIGNGQVIEAAGTEIGVIQSPLVGGNTWTNWLQCPYIHYLK